MSREVEGMLEIWEGAGEQRKPGERRIGGLKGFQLNRPGLHALFQAGPKERWRTSALFQDQHTPIPPCSVVSESPAHPAGSWSS